MADNRRHIRDKLPFEKYLEEKSIRNRRPTSPQALDRYSYNQYLDELFTGQSKDPAMAERYRLTNAQYLPKSDTATPVQSSVMPTDEGREYLNMIRAEGPRPHSGADPLGVQIPTIKQEHSTLGATPKILTDKQANEQHATGLALSNHRSAIEQLQEKLMQQQYESEAADLARYNALLQEQLGYVPGQSADATQTGSGGESYVGKAGLEPTKLSMLNTPSGGVAFVPQENRDSIRQKWIDEEKAKQMAPIADAAKKNPNLLGGGPQVMSRQKWEEQFPKAAEAQREYEKKKNSLAYQAEDISKPVSERKAARRELSKVRIQEARALAKAEREDERQHEKDIEMLKSDMRTGKMNAKRAAAHAAKRGALEGETITNVNAILIKNREAGGAGMSGEQLDALWAQFENDDQFASFLQDATDILQSNQPNQADMLELMMRRRVEKYKPKKKK